LSIHVSMQGIRTRIDGRKIWYVNFGQTEAGNPRPNRLI
jgi:hypothetical protein